VTSLGWMMQVSPAKHSPIGSLLMPWRNTKPCSLRKRRRPLVIDYAAAVNGNLVLTPSGEGLRPLGEDYTRMVDDGLLLGDSEPFEHLIERCAQIQARANKADTSGSENTGK